MQRRKLAGAATSTRAAMHAIATMTAAMAGAAAAAPMATGAEPLKVAQPCISSRVQLRAQDTRDARHTSTADTASCERAEQAGTCRCVTRLQSLTTTGHDDRPRAAGDRIAVDELSTTRHGMSPGAGARRAVERANGLPYCWEGMPKIAPLTHASRRLMAAAPAIDARRGRTASMV